MKPSGIRTVIYAAPDLAKARDWYTQAFEQAPYFDEPFYVGFDINHYELGLDPNMPLQEGSTVAYWEVKDIKTDFDRLLALGAAAYDAPNDVGGGIIVGTVQDPFGNKIGLIQMPGSNQ
ncbi:VOC family protein [Telluribacter sp.]|jgi:lactoylglutathione lyase|uniref:VOC family protein n=1 Tax=Telluribacter sp. TaxID=1978767 RepID=UPI002E0D2473|nr:VOC family protein [Telluribacter sp.]